MSLLFKYEFHAHERQWDRNQCLYTLQIKSINYLYKNPKQLEIHVSIWAMLWNIGSSPIWPFQPLGCMMARNCCFWYTQLKIDKTILGLLILPPVTQPFQFSFLITKKNINVKHICISLVRTCVLGFYRTNVYRGNTFHLRIHVLTFCFCFSFCEYCLN